jgi:hypothetical protein
MTVPPFLPHADTAKACFTKFHSQNNIFMMGPGRFIFSGEEQKWNKVLIPFWIFKGSFRYKHKLKGWPSWAPEERLQLTESDVAMQVCGSFKYRTDFLEILKGSYVPLVRETAGMSSFVKQDVDLGRALAWTFVLRNAERLLHSQLANNYENVSEDDVRVHVLGIPNQSRIVYLPAHVVEYTYGNKIDVHGERSKDTFYSIINAFGGEVASNVHVSVKKAAAAGGASAAGVMALLAQVGYEAPLGWTTYDYGFISAGSAATAALITQILLKMQTNTRSITQNLSGEGDEREELDVLYKREWTRWEEGSLGTEPRKRRRWAESIWKSHRNRLKRLRYVIATRQEAEKRDREAQWRRKRLEEKWGAEDRFSSRDRDFLGYYKALGLEPDNALSKHHIKLAFLRQVRVLHPDTTLGSSQDPDDKKAFLKVMEAYDILRNEESRQKYDRGEKPG